ncbi:ribonuclease VapC [Spirochaetia bacterium]|nr:ribonuclease VapC [Spirochaetia bacterium]
MLIDSDVLIWFYRGKVSAQQAIFQNIPFSLSAVSYMEIIQGVRNKEELTKLKKDLRHWGAAIVHLSEPISENAVNLLETYTLSHGLELGDAIIAATALAFHKTLLTGNTKHYDYIPHIQVIPFTV